jgi:hypothetical protein
MCRLGLRLCLLPLLLAPPQAIGQTTRGRSPACSAAEVPDTLLSFTAHGTIRLAGQGEARLAGLRLPEEGRERAAALLRARGGTVRVRPLGEADRWGRRPVQIAFAEGGDAGESLTEEGLAVVDPAPGEPFCQPELLALEATARERGLGVWAGDGSKPIPAGDAERLAARIGRFAIVEGRVRSVGERRQRTYLNFGADWASDFTVVVTNPAFAVLAERGLTAAALRGRRVRVRGVLEDWRGTAITVTVAEIVEVLETERGGR